MKKLIIFAGAMLLLAAGTVGFFANRPMSTQEALILKNVEAIASGEGTEKFWPAVETSGTCRKCGQEVDICVAVIMDATCEIVPHSC